MDKAFPGKKVDAIIVVNLLIRKSVFIITQWKESPVVVVVLSTSFKAVKQGLTNTTVYYHYPCLRQSSNTVERTNGILRLKLIKLATSNGLP